MQKQFLDSIVELTRAREPEILSGSLLASLAGHVPILGISKIQLLDEKNLAKAEQTVSLKIDRSQMGIDGEKWDEEPRRFRLSQDVVDRIPEGNFFTLTAEKGTSTYVPVFDEDKPSSLIKIDTVSDITEQRELIHTIVEIYTNILRVLEDGQRDKLTGLLNRRTFDSKLDRMMDLQRKAVKAYRDNGADRRSVVKTKLAWLAIIDIDHFKRVNDVHGHMCGDEVIFRVGQMMKQVFRSTDLLFRFGGEEFVVVLEPMPSASAMVAFERFRETIQRQVFDPVGQVTVSVGFAGLEEGEHPPQVIDRADQALYYAKEHGRNQVANYQALIEVGQMQVKELATG